MFNKSWHGRGRGRGHYSATPRDTRPPSAPSDQIPIDLGEIISILPSEQIVPTKSSNTTIRDVQSVASYNWLDTIDQPTIAIPGVPCRWTPPMTDPQLSEDSGTYYRDLNAAYCPQHPLYPVALAIFASHSVSTAEVDLMACASTLRSLFEFTRGERKTFRIMVEEVGTTVFLIRREGSPRETIADVRGYGHAMPEAYTTWDREVRGSVSNQRVVQYKFAGLNCLVRYEPDGYLPNKLSVEPAEGAAAASTTSSTGHAPSDDDFDGLTTAISGAKVATLLTSESDFGDFKVTHAGIDIPQSATFELKTRSVRRKDEDYVREFAPRLWLTQTPYFVLGLHFRGRFGDVRVLDVRNEIAQWEVENLAHIKRFAGLLEWIIGRVKAEPDGLMELWRHEKGAVEVRKPGSEFHGALPSDLEDHWAGGDIGGVSLAKDESQE